MKLPIANSTTPETKSDLASRTASDAEGGPVQSRGDSSGRRSALAPPSADLEEAVGVRAADLAAQYALEAVKGFGPAKFREIFDEGIALTDVVREPDRLPTMGSRGIALRNEIARLGPMLSQFEQRAYRQILYAARRNAHILTYWHDHYPKQLLASNNPVPALYVVGPLEVVADPHGVACIGSRTIREPYTSLHANFARIAVGLGLTVVSGFALGADTVGHRAAYEAGGRTVGVMPCGLDRPFPPENRVLWHDLLSYRGAAFVSEYPFGTRASGLTLRKRNKLIVALAMGVLMSQSSATGGAMNAYRSAVEMRRPFATFEPDGTEDTAGNRMTIDAQRGSVTVLRHDDMAEAGHWLRQLFPLT